MEQFKWADELVSFMRRSLDTTMSTLSTYQEQGEKILHMLLDQGVVAQQEGRKMLTEWLEMGRKGRDDYKRLMTQNLEKISDFFRGLGGGGGKAK